MSAKTYTTKEAIELLRQGKRIKASLSLEVIDYFLYMKDSRIYNIKSENFSWSEVALSITYSDMLWIEVHTQETISKLVIEKPCPCCKCHSLDDYNSKGKDGNWYCYVHCSY